MVKLLFRKPIFPVMIETDKRLLGIPDLSDFKILPQNTLFKNKENYQVIDCRAEGWIYHPKMDVLSPLGLNKKWTKAKLIDLFNQLLENTGINAKIKIKSLSNITFEKLVYSLTDLSISIEEDLLLE